MTNDKDSLYGRILVARGQRGDMAALEELVKAWERRLFYYIRRLVDQEADAWDVLQKTWMKVFRGLRSLKDTQSLPCWLYTVARNTAIDHQRSLHRHARPQSLKSTATESPTATDSDAELILDNAEAVHKALARLSLAHREVLTLYFLQDLSLKEIAEVVGINLGTVKSRLHYARSALRRQLQEDR